MNGSVGKMGKRENDFSCKASHISAAESESLRAWANSRGGGYSERRTGRQRRSRTATKMDGETTGSCHNLAAEGGRTIVVV